MGRSRVFRSRDILLPGCAALKSNRKALNLRYGSGSSMAVREALYSRGPVLREKVTILRSRNSTNNPLNAIFRDLIPNYMTSKTRQLGQLGGTIS